MQGRVRQLTIRTITHSADNICQRLELNVVTRLARPKGFQSIVRRVLEYVERVRYLKPASQAVLLHDFSDVCRTCSMVFSALLLIEAWVAAHERHIMDFCGVIYYAQDFLVPVAPETLSNSWLHTTAVISAVRHRDPFSQVRVVDPCDKVNHLFAIEVNDSKLLAFLDLEGETVACFDNFCRCGSPSMKSFVSSR